MNHAIHSTDLVRTGMVTARQLQWWDERRAVSPKHDHHRRLYTHPEALTVLIIAELRTKRISLQKARKLLPSIKRTLRTHTLPLAYLLTDGTKAIWAASPKEAVDLLVGLKTPMLLVCVTDLQRRLPEGAPAR